MCGGGRGDHPVQDVWQPSFAKGKKLTSSGGTSMGKYLEMYPKNNCLYD